MLNFMKFLLVCIEISGKLVFDLCCFRYRLSALDSKLCEKGCCSCVRLLALFVISCKETRVCWNSKLLLNLLHLPEIKSNV